MATGNDPFADLLTLQRDMDRIMTRFGMQQRRGGNNGHSFWMPAVDVYTQGADMIVRVELAGVDPSDITVSVTGNVLAIKGERRQDQRVNDDDYVMRETTYGTFERRITLPQEIDAGKVRAQYRAGVLEVTVPGSAMIAPRTQQVQVGGTRQAAMGGEQQPSMGAQPQPQYGRQEPYAPPEQQTQYREQQSYTQQTPPEGQRQQQYEQAYGTRGSAQQQGGEQSYEQQLHDYNRVQVGGEIPGQEPMRQPAAGGAPDTGGQAQASGAQGGWVVPEHAQQPRETRDEQREQGEKPEEERQRSGIRSWLHGSDENR